MEAIVRHRDEGVATWFMNGLLTTKASAEETAGAYALIDSLVTAAANPPTHMHTDEDEAFFVLDGEIEFDVAGEVATATPGSYVLAPRSTAHTFRVLTDTARMLVITSSAGAARRCGFQPFTVAAGEPADNPVLPVPAAPDPAVLTALAAHHGIEILGPPAP